VTDEALDPTDVHEPADACDGGLTLRDELALRELMSLYCL
jgi:hypothetical protein